MNSLEATSYDKIENQLENFGISRTCNPAMYRLVENLQKKFCSDIKVVHVGPASTPKEKKTDVILKLDNNYIKAFTKEGRNLGETEYGGIKSFNSFCTENDSSFSGPEIVEEGETEDGGFYFMMKNAGEIVNFSKEEIEKIREFYDKYRQTFDKFEKDSKGKTSKNSKMQRFYYLYKKYLQPEVSSEFTTKSSKIINGAKTALCNVLQPTLKSAIGRKYKSKVGERISNGEDVVKKCGINIDREKINKTLDKLLSKVKRFDFEYNFGRLWTDHVFSDGENYKFVDFDNVGYQIKGTELICLMWDNLLISTGNYDSYEEDWKPKYNKWYGELLGMYKDENLVKLLLFVKLIGTIFEDYGNLICNRKTGRKKEGQENESIEKIRKGVKWNYKVLQELMDRI